MFDIFDPFYQLKHQPFEFFSSRYEIWKAGKMVQLGSTNTQIIGKVKKTVMLKKYSRVILSEYNLNTEITSINDFDVLITGHDCLQFLTIPAKGNNMECMELSRFKNIVGATRPSKHFLETEPYCCNLFLQNKAIMKVTFAFNFPEKLIEFHLE